MNEYEAQEERRRAILQWLCQRGSIAVAELVVRFSVSRMTVHRDLGFLVDQGAVRKRHGWVELVDALPNDQRSKGTCAVCQGYVGQRTNWIQQLFNGQQRSACCPCCGLTLYAESVGVRAVRAREYLYGRFVDAKRAVFVAESRVSCSCGPSLLVFGDRVDAADFQRGFGGAVLNFHEALASIDAGRSARASLSRTPGAPRMRPSSQEHEAIGTLLGAAGVMPGSPSGDRNVGRYRRLSATGGVVAAGGVRAPEPVDGHA